MQHILGAKNIIIERHENYLKQTYRNRCRILSANDVLNLTIPVKKVSSVKQIINHVKTEQDFNWKKEHWNSIVSAYSKSSFFLYYSDEFESVFRNEQEDNLFEFNLTLLKVILKLLKKEAEFSFSEKYEKTYSDEFVDLRNFFSPKNPNSEKELVFTKNYLQVFSDKFPFRENLSVIDLLFNKGPESLEFLFRY